MKGTFKLGYTLGNTVSDICLFLNKRQVHVSIGSTIYENHSEPSSKDTDSSSTKKNHQERVTIRPTLSIDEVIIDPKQRVFQLKVTFLNETHDDMYLPPNASYYGTEFKLLLRNKATGCLVNTSIKINSGNYLHKSKLSVVKPGDHITYSIDVLHLYKPETLFDKLHGIYVLDVWYAMAVFDREHKMEIYMTRKAKTSILIMQPEIVSNQQEQIKLVSTDAPQHLKFTLNC